MVRRQNDARLNEWRRRCDQAREEWRAQVRTGEARIVALAAADDPPAIGRGRHIAKLLDLAQGIERSGDFHADRKARQAIIDAWNGWVKDERGRDPLFRPELAGFNAAAPAWRHTPLWGKGWDLDEAERLTLPGIDWAGADLEAAVLRGVYVRGADLRGADLPFADLRRAGLALADLTDADLWEANLRHATLEEAKLCRAFLMSADLRGARFKAADLRDAVLRKADLSGADLRRAHLAGAEVEGIRCVRHAGLWPLRRNRMLGKYLGIRGADGLCGDAGFRRDAMDQDFIDGKFLKCMLWQELGWEANLRRFRVTRSRWFGWLVNPPAVFVRALRWRELPLRLIPRFFFLLWGLCDYGRSLAGVGLIALATIGLFGLGYQTWLMPTHLAAADYLQGPAAPWLAAALGGVSLGLSDAVQAKDTLGAVALLANALAGFFFFATTAGVMVNTFARRG